MNIYKVLAACLKVIALILSHAMCANVAYVYCALQWGGEYAGYSAPTYVAFFLAIPYLVCIIFALIIALGLSRKAKKQADR